MPYLFSFALSSISCWFSFAQDAIIPYKEILQMYWEKVTGFVNACCDGLEPWQLIGLTFSSTLASVWLHGFLCQPESKCLTWGIVPHLEGGEVALSCSWAVEGKRVKQGQTLVKTDFLLSPIIYQILFWIKVKACLGNEDPPFHERVHGMCFCLLPFPLSPFFLWLNHLLVTALSSSADPGEIYGELGSCGLSHCCKVSG